MVWYCLLERNEGVSVPPKKREKRFQRRCESSTPTAVQVRAGGFISLPWDGSPEAGKGEAENCCAQVASDRIEVAAFTLGPLLLKDVSVRVEVVQGKRLCLSLYDQTFKIFLWYFCPSDCGITGRWTLNLTKLIINSKNSENSSASHSKQNCKQLGYLHNKPPQRL